MIFIKVAGFLLLAAAGTGCGIYAALRLKSRIVLLESYLVFLKEVEIKVRFGQCSIEEILSSDYENEVLNFILQDCRKHLHTASRFSTVWIKTLSQVQNKGKLSQQEFLLFKAFADFGTSDVEGELSRLEMHRQKVTQQYEALLKEYADKGKLYRTLGIFGGTALGLIII